MPNDVPKIAFTGGGTGGHVYPAFPVADRVRASGYAVFWIGSRRGMEREIVDRAGIPYVAVPTGKMRRYFSFQNFVDIFRILAGFFASILVLARRRPVILFSKGGFVSVPPVAAARILRIPAFSHESDADPGLATRINARFGATILVPYEKTREALAPSVRKQAVVTGNPVRDAVFQGDPIEGRRIAGNADKRPLILVLGGSLGARQVNDLIASILPSLLEVAVVVHQTGQGNETASPRDGYRPVGYFHDELPHLLAAATVAITRAGAGTLWELAASGTPGVVIPLEGSGTRGDQVRNAELFEKLGAVTVLSGESASSTTLLETVVSLLENPQRLAEMTAAAKKIPAREAADTISRLLLEAVT